MLNDNKWKCNICSETNTYSNKLKFINKKDIEFKKSSTCNSNGAIIKKFSKIIV